MGKKQNKTHKKKQKSIMVIYILCLKTSNFKKKKVFTSYVNQPRTYYIADKRHFPCSILLLAA